MNTDSFARFLRNPSLLHQISYQELRTLALQYPYCQNLHWLLLQKSYMEAMPEWEQNLHRAAAHSTDRKFLYRQMKMINASRPETDNFLLEEEYLELKSLSEMEQVDAEALLRTGQSPAAPPPAELGLEAQPDRIEPTPPAPEPGGFSFTFPSEKGAHEEEDVFEEPDAEAGLAPKEEEGMENHVEQPEEKQELETEKAEPATDNQLHSRAVQAEPASPAYRVEKSLVLNMAAISRFLSGFPRLLSTPSPHLARAAADKKDRPRISPQLAALKNQPYSRGGRHIAPRQDAPLSPQPARPQPRQSFTSWVEQFQAPHIQNRLGELMESKKMDEKGKKKNRNKDKNRQKNAKPENPLPRNALISITESEEIASETLAELLAAQGLADKAREMYQRLMLVFPEKSDYFASKIENLKSE